jgi:carbon monoxide dehydrogenase subunit G
MAIELDNSFTVPVPPEQAWDVLLDVERIAPCMPGASVTSVEGDEIEGQVKVKLGPLSLTYKGTAKFTDKDQASHTISIEATGKETRGSGTASATVQANLTPGDSAGQTLVSIHTSLNVTGKPAQFGRSLLPEVSGKLIQQFATNLEAMINADSAADQGTAAPEAAADAGTDEAGAKTAPAAGAGAVQEPAGSAQAAPAAARPAAPVVKQEESLNAFKFVVVPILKRLIPVAAVGAAIAVVFSRLRRKRA